LKILILDIECSLNKVFTFPTFKATIPPKQIIEPSRVLCWAAKWLDGKRVNFADERDDEYIEKIYALIDKADAIIHYNGAAFDMKHLNREFLLRGFPPPTPYLNIDLLTVVRKNFRFVSNKLEWVSVQLGYSGKITHRGIQLWIDCQEHNKAAAWKEMREYNVRDVTELEPIYYDLRPWVTNHPNWGHHVDFHKSETPVCKNCGSEHIKKNGVVYNTTVTYQRWRCTDCGANMRGRRKIYTNKGRPLSHPHTT